jgi:hypothetical protein
VAPGREPLGEGRLQAITVATTSNRLQTARRRRPGRAKPPNQRKADIFFIRVDRSYAMRSVKPQRPCQAHRERRGGWRRAQSGVM